MSHEIKAGASYSIAVFIVAFVLGIIRVSFLVPRIGEVISVSLEAPIILAVSWFASRWSTGQFRLASSISSRMTMGAVAFGLLMAIELTVATLAFGEPIGDYFAAFWSPQGAIGLGTQIAFAFIPVIQRTRHVLHRRS